MYKLLVWIIRKLVILAGNYRNPGHGEMPYMIRRVGNDVLTPLHVYTQYMNTVRLSEGYKEPWFMKAKRAMHNPMYCILCAIYQIDFGNWEFEWDDWGYEIVNNKEELPSTHYLKWHTFKAMVKKGGD